jgi:hypothetical protein
MKKQNYKMVKSAIPPPRGLTGAARIIFKDSGGNRLFAKRKPDGIVQYSAKNAENKLVCRAGVTTLMKRWNRQR